MKAIVTTGYGSTDVLQLRDLPKPVPQDNEILLRVRAGVVTSADGSFRKGDPFIIKLMYGLRRPRYPVLGVEMAGDVEAVGKHVRQFKPGDRVYALSPHNFGAHAEYKCLPADLVMALMPENVNYQEAAGILDGATTSLTFLRDRAKVQPGQKVLVNGASGAVGAYGVQIAKALGAEVTGVCSTRNIDLVKSLGADYVIDYTQSDFTRTTSTYDVIYDAVGKSSFSECKAALKPGGVYLTTVPLPGALLQMLWTSLRGGKRAFFVASGLIQKPANLHDIKAMVEAGSLKPVIDRCYPLAEMAEAHRYVDTGRKRGNVVISMDD